MKCPYCIKVCSGCKEILVAYSGNFNKRKENKDGLNTRCKECIKKTNKQWREEKYFTVYMHISPSNKRYIGLTGKNVKYRWANGEGYRTNKHFYNAIKKIWMG